MRTYKFYPVPSEHCQFITLKNCIVYLNNIFLCSSAYSIILSYTILGKQLCIYNLNGQKIFVITFPDTLKEIAYIHFTNSIYFETSTKAILVPDSNVVNLAST